MFPVSNPEVTLGHSVSSKGLARGGGGAGGGEEASLEQSFCEEFRSANIRLK